MAFHFLHLHQFPILEQLKIEEALLRSDQRNWCLINEGSPVSIVMGISGKKEELVDLESARRDNVPIIKRFSGGGTVIVDENTLFVTFICDKKSHSFPAFPEPIMKWTEGIYKDVFVHDQFRLRENDFVIGEKKVGGNAQYIKKDRWLHHTSFLWNYSDKTMEYLLHPKKTPNYRSGRSHSDFLYRLSDHFPHMPEIIEKIKKSLKKNFEICPSSLDEARLCQSADARQSTTLIT